MLLLALVVLPQLWKEHQFFLAFWKQVAILTLLPAPHLLISPTTPSSFWLQNMPHPVNTILLFFSFQTTSCGNFLFLPQHLTRSQDNLYGNILHILDVLAEMQVLKEMCYGQFVNIEHRGLTYAH